MLQHDTNAPAKKDASPAKRRRVITIDEDTDESPEGMPALSDTIHGNCVFPFVCKGLEYNGCTDVNNDGVPWCSTTPNYDEDGQWGVCASEAYPIHEAKPIAVSNTPGIAATIQSLDPTHDAGDQIKLWNIRFQPTKQQT